MELFGLQVDLELTVKNINDIKKQVKDALKNLPANVSTGMSDLAGGIQGGLFGTGSAGSTGLAALGKLVGGITLIAGVVQVIGKTMKQMLDVVSRASPHLQGIRSVMERSFTYFMKPFGDFLASLLRPLAILLLKAAAKWLEFSRTEPGQQVVAGSTGAVIGAGIGGVAGTLIGGPGGGTAIGAGIGAAVGAGIGLIENNWDIITEGVDRIAELASEWIDSFIETVGNFFTKTVPEFVNYILSSPEEIGESIGTAIYDFVVSAVNILGDIGNWIWDKLVNIFNSALSILSDVGQWIWNAIITFIEDPLGVLSDIGTWIFDTIKTIFTTSLNVLSTIGTTIFNIVKSAIEKSLNAVGSIADWFSKFIKGIIKGIVGRGRGESGSGENQIGTEGIPQTGWYWMHEGEKVTPRHQAESGGGKMVNITQKISFPNATFRNDYDADDMIRRASQRTILELKMRGVLG